MDEDRIQRQEFPVKKSFKGPGVYLPLHNLALGGWSDGPDGAEPSPRQSSRSNRSNLSNLAMGSLDVQEAPATRRLKKEARLPSPRIVHVGIRQVERPERTRSVFSVHNTSKRCFPEKLTQATAFNNPDTWEEMGLKKPNHAAQESTVGKLCFGLPAPPNGAEWGGWGVKGAPGRKPMLQPWEVPERMEGGEDGLVFSDARRQKFEDRHSSHTASLVQWHPHEPHKIRTEKIHINVPLDGHMPEGRGAESVALPTAGRPTKVGVFGEAGKR
mmetsp:Transcript_36553/g.66986  ORF Transcript_36553/g.66986 Transcript_36553/m.66986 type:complete len:271 (+) Transcript_36553:57-869(+)